MGEVIVLNTGYTGVKNCTPLVGEFYAGFAAGICDAHRFGANVKAALVASGISYETFIKAGVDAYDLETLEEILKSY